jgi:potassium-transporting ATPase KdpC subunit
MRATIRTAVLMLIVLTALTGLIYPLAVTGAARLLFPRQSCGSLIRRDGQVIGSALIGQSFTDPRYFWGRPSAATPPYNAAASTGSNLGPSSRALADSIGARLARLRCADPGNPAPVPVDLITASGSGLDPHLSPAAAFYQAGRVARLRGLDPEAVRALVRRHIEERQFGLLGEPRVNVLELNLALDAMTRTP